MVSAQRSGATQLNDARDDECNEQLAIAIGAATLNVRRIPAGGAGAPATIVFLHDSLGCIKLWRDFPDRLCALTGCSGLIYDRQGYGESSPFTDKRGLDYLEREGDVLVEVLRREGEQRKFILFGHSDGGSIALIAAAKLGAGVAPAVVGVITEGAHVFVEDVTLDGIRAAVAEKAQLLPRIRKYHGEKSEAVFDAWADTWLKPEFRDFNMEHFLPAISCDVLVIQGEVDEYGTEAQVNAIIAGVSGARKHKLMVPGVGHTPHRDAADFVLEACTNFIAGCNYGISKS